MIIGISGKIGSGKDTVAKLLMEEIIHAKGATDARCKHTDTKVLAEEGLQFLSGWNVRRFAGKLKEMVAEVTGCKPRDLESHDFKNSDLGPEWDRTTKDAIEYLKLKGLTTDYVVNTMSDTEIRDWVIKTGFKFTRTYRELLQEMGNAMRELHPDFWVNALFSQYKMIPSESRHWAGHAISMKEPDPDHYPDWVIPDTRYPNEVYAIKQRGGIVVRINRPIEAGPDKYTKAANIVREHSSETALDRFQGFDVVIENVGTIEDLRIKVIDLVTQFKLHIQNERAANNAATKTSIE